MRYKNSYLEKAGLFFKKHYVLLISFFLPIITLLIAFIVCGIYPFGKWSLLIIDLYHQYAPFLSELQDKLRTFSGLFYSWSGGLGTSFLPLFAYYLASPLNILIILIPKNFLSETVLLLVLIKVALAGLTFSLYLRYVYNEKGLLSVVFSTFYSLSGYVLAFSWNIMWMDTIYLLPLIIIGLVRLVRDSRGIFYCIILAITLLSNFYISFFVCFFILLYYPLCLLRYGSVGKCGSVGKFSFIAKNTIKFAGFSLLSGGLSAVLLFPTYFALKSTSAANDIFPKTIHHYFDFFDYITRHFVAASPSIREGMPNIYCGVVVLVLVPAYFLCKHIKLKEKLGHLALLTFLILSFNINILDFIWHGFHYPNQVPYRFSFVYIFLILSMSYQAYRNLDEFTGKQIGFMCMIVFGLTIVSQKLDGQNLSLSMLYSTGIFMILYAVSLTIDKSTDMVPNKAFSMTLARTSYSNLLNPGSLKVLLVFLIAVAEIITNTILVTVKIDSTESYSLREGYSAGEEVAQILEWISDLKNLDKSFYRMEILPPKTTNDPYLYNYRGLSIFSSTIPEKTVRLFENLGYHSNSINSYKYEGSTAILDSLFGIKYVFYRNLNIEESLYKKIKATDKMVVFENPYALSIGFQTSNNMKSFLSSATNPFDIQNSLISCLCEVNGVLTPIDTELGSQSNLTLSGTGTNNYYFNRTNKGEISTARIQFEVEKDQQVYLYYNAPHKMKGTGFINIRTTSNSSGSYNSSSNSNTYSYSNSNSRSSIETNLCAVKNRDFNPAHSTIINLGFCKSGSSCDLQLLFEKDAPESGKFEIYVCGLERQAFKDAISLIKEKSLIIDKFAENRILGKIESEEKGTMVMTIPYNKGWHAKVNGQKVETWAVDDCLLAFDLPSGSNNIDLKFMPEGYFSGIIVTITSILLFILISFKETR